MGLSHEELKRITPDTIDLNIHDQLITILKKASAVNMIQTEPKNSITELYQIGIVMSKRIPNLATLF